MALRRIVFVLACVAVGAYYLWGVRATGYPFLWGRGDLNGYYDYLGQAFAKGHLYLPVDPAPELLALPNPYNPAAGIQYKLWDTSLYRRHYYLYFGAAPAVILFAPWRLLTGHDMPENFALFLFCFGGYLFSCGALTRILSLAEARVGTAMLAAMLLALGICQCIPYLLNRVWVYEIAIGSGYCCVSGAFFMLARSIGANRKIYWLPASGLMFGLAVACRPNLLLAAVTALGGVAIITIKTHGGKWTAAARELIAFMVPMATVGAGIALYNYARFGDPFDLGYHYLLSGPFQNRLKLDIANLLPGLYYNLFCRPELTAIFPWVRTVFRHLAHPLPAEFFLEPTTGALFLAPFIAGALLVPAAKRSGPDAVRVLLWTMTVSSAIVLLFDAVTGFVTQRYEVDFLPLAALAALACAGIWLSRSAGWRRIVLNAALSVSLAFGAVVNLALGLTGPYNDVQKNRPANYARLARWFSPVADLRPLMNPRLNVEIEVEFGQQPDSVREPLLTIGGGPYAQFLYAERRGEQDRLVLKTELSNTTYDMPAPGAKPVAVEVTYTRESGKLRVAVDGREVLAADAGVVFTAPAQVTPGENRIDSGTTPARFTGGIRVIRKIVQEK